MQLSDKLIRMPEPYQDFFWVDFSWAAGLLFSTPRAIQDTINRLCGNFKKSIINMEYPFAKITAPPSSGRKGVRCGLSINKNVLLDFIHESLISEEKMNKISNNKLIECNINPNQKSARIITSEIQKIFDCLFQIQIGGEKLFRNRLPHQNKGKHTKALTEAAKKIWSLYEGKFFREYIPSENFEKRWCYLFNDDAKKKVLAAKGSWEGVEKLLLEAAKNYRYWFRPEREPENKEWLQHELSWWLFDSYDNQSIFLTCINKPPDNLRELKADRIYQSLPVSIQEIAEEIYHEGWDSSNFWWRIKEVVQWFQNHHSDLIQQDSNATYWFDGGLVGWFQKYVKWLKEFDEVYLKQLGVDNNTWVAWCTHGAKVHKIKVKFF